MTLPDYQRPFDPSDFRGYFTWSKKLTEKLAGEYLYHACHFEELQKIIKRNRLVLRSSWAIDLPEHGVCNVPGVWCGLNYFYNGNHYGPFLIRFPLSALEGKQFIAFRRGGKSERHRYFFVQYDAQIPIYSFKGDTWRSVRPEAYFTENDDGTLTKKIGGIYDIVLTNRISLDASVTVSSVGHDKCIPGKCNGSRRGVSRKKLREFAKEILKDDLLDSDIIEKYINKFPELEGENLEIIIERNCPTRHCSGPG